MGPDKHIGIAASVVLPEHIADMIDEEMRRRRLPSRSAMIRAAIEDYFSPADNDRRDEELRAHDEEMKHINLYLASREELIIALKDSVKRCNESIELYRGPVVQAAHTLLAQHAGPPMVIPQPATRKWWQFWKRGEK